MIELKGFSLQKEECVVQHFYFSFRLENFLCTMRFTPLVASLLPMNYSTQVQKWDQNLH